MLVSRWCYQSGLLKVIGQFSLNGIGCKTRIKFVIGHWSVLIHLLLVTLVCWSSVCPLVYRVDKILVENLSGLSDSCDPALNRL